MTTQHKTPASRSQRLNQITHAPHEQLDRAVKAHAPFETLASYTRFVIAQYLFQAELQSLYSDRVLRQLIPGLPERCRAEHARADLADLGVEPGVESAIESGAAASAPVAGKPHDLGIAEALGWLFVSEGSKLGAAFLIKRAVTLGLSDQFGARHLSESEHGRAVDWRVFTRILDSLPFTAEQEAEMDKGALAAFERFNVLLQHAYDQAPRVEVA